MAWLTGQGNPQYTMSGPQDPGGLQEFGGGNIASSGVIPEGGTPMNAAAGAKINPAAAQFLASMLKSSPQQPGVATPTMPGMPSPIMRQGPTSPGDFLRQAMTIASLRQLAGGGRGGA